jgi:hypothetical protein
MLLSGKAVTLRIYLCTHDKEVVMVELDTEDLEKAAMGKTNFTEEQLHPVKLLHFDLA